MKKITLLILLATLSLGAMSQVSITYSPGYGAYRMKDLKETMIPVLPNYRLPENTKLIANFPSYLMHSIDIGFPLKRNEYGLKLSFMTTGAKLGTADYSGSYQENIITNGYRIAPFFRFHFIHINLNRQLNLSFFTELSAGLTVASLKTNGLLILHTDDGSIMDKANEYYRTDNHISIQPLGGMRLKIYDNFLLSLSAGYDFDLSENTGGKRIDFNGLRLNAGIGYLFQF